MKGNKNDHCLLCGGTKKPRTTTFTAGLGFGVVVQTGLLMTLPSALRNW